MGSSTSGALRDRIRGSDRRARPHRADAGSHSRRSRPRPAPCAALFGHPGLIAARTSPRPALRVGGGDWQSAGCLECRGQDQLACRARTGDARRGRASAARRTGIHRMACDRRRRLRCHNSVDHGPTRPRRTRLVHGPGFDGGGAFRAAARTRRLRSRRHRDRRRLLARGHRARGTSRHPRGPGHGRCWVDDRRPCRLDTGRRLPLSRHDRLARRCHSGSAHRSR